MLFLCPDALYFWKRILNTCPGRDNHLKLKKMRKIIPILCLSMTMPLLLQCTERTEDTQESLPPERSLVSKTLPGKDSVQLSETVVDPDPPVRDGDHWRSPH